MLLELKVTHFAIIDNDHIQFGPGLNILSGETGAGKSVLIKGLGLLMGVKGSSEQIRSGHTTAAIEGSSDLQLRSDVKSRLDELGIPLEEGKLIVRRVLSEGKSRVYMNGSLCTLQQLRDVISPLLEVASTSAPLIEMTGQHDARHLLSKAYHLDIVDSFAGLWDLRRTYQEDFRELQSIEGEIQELRSRVGQVDRELDYLRFQREEIIQFDPQPGEDVNLEMEIKRLKSHHKIIAFHQLLQEAFSSDRESLLGTVSQIQVKAQELRNQDPGILEIGDRLSLLQNQIDEVLFFSQRQLQSQMDQEVDLDALEERLSQLRKLQKKYGQSIDEILAHLLRIETQIHQMENFEQSLEKLQARKLILLEDLAAQGEKLHQLRVKAIKDLVQKVNHELLDLNMKGVRFTVHAERNRTEEGTPILTSTGLTEIEFCTQSSLKDQPRPLAKFASGGELSRILLSIKSVCGAGELPRTFLFDEVDTGISGETAEKVGKKLKSISQGQQVICVTHLPQVAIHGDVHFFIHKKEESTSGPARGENGSPSMEVKLLRGSERVREIARLVSGERITPASLQHAQEHLAEAQI